MAANATNWLFESAEFKNWVEGRQRSEADEGRSTCSCCGGPLDPHGRRHGDTCGYCLAYEFGVQSQSRRFANTLACVIRTAIEDEEALARLTSQLLEESEALNRAGTDPELVGGIPPR